MPDSQNQNLLNDLVSKRAGRPAIDADSVHHVFDPLFSQIRRLYCLDQYQCYPDGHAESDVRPLIHDAIIELRDTLSAIDKTHFDGQLYFAPNEG